MFYDVYCQLCKDHGITPSGAAKEIGFSKGTVSTWKSRGTTPASELLNKIAEYFSCVHRLSVRERGYIRRNKHSKHRRKQ